MARPKDPEKRRSILDAAVQEIAASGLGAPTSKIAKRAGVAEGTLFTYFATKEELLNELYIALKNDFYTRVEADPSPSENLEARAKHIWLAHLNWALRFPLRRRVSQQLHISTLLSHDARKRASGDFKYVHETMALVDQRTTMQGLPPGTSSFLMASFQEAAMELIARYPAQREAIAERMFALFWRAVR